MKKYLVASSSSSGLEIIIKCHCLVKFWTHFPYVTKWMARYHHSSLDWDFDTVAITIINDYGPMMSEIIKMLPYSSCQSSIVGFCKLKNYNVRFGGHLISCN
jgi:hypothetical protein